MKKKLLISILSLMMCVSCGFKNGNADNTTVIKVLLANERLNDDTINNDNIFVDGKKAFDTIKESSIHYSNKIKQNNIKESFNINGNRYIWKDTPDYSNFFDYFNSYSSSIEYNATQGSLLIDNTKNNVRTIDKWVKIKNEEVLLSVEKNKETIISRTDDQYEICNRTQNEYGQNVFEMFIANSSTDAKSRMKYIPNLRYEFTSIQHDNMFVVVADKDKGYWNIMSTSFNLNEEIEETFFTNLVIKDESIYETTYSNGINNEYYGDIKIISSDSKNDMIRIEGNNVYIYTTGINNLDSFYIDVSNDQVIDITNTGYPENIDNYQVFVIGEGNDKSYFTINNSSVIAKFENGKEMKIGDTFYDDAVEVLGTNVEPIGGIDFYGIINLYFKSDDVDSILNYLNRLMNDYNFTFKDDFEVINESIKYAYVDSSNFKDYYLWHNMNINNLDNVKNIVNLEKELINNFVKLYEKNKDFEVINSNKQLSIDGNLKFSNIRIVFTGEINNSDFNISVDNFSVEVEDTSLFNVGEEYYICFALAIEKEGNYYNLLPLDLKESITKTFNGESNFILQQKASFSIPTLEEGEYFLVSYVASKNDDIRVTNPVSVEANVNNVHNNEDGIINEISNKNNKIVVLSSKTSLINITLNNITSYDELYFKLESYAYKHGNTLNGKIEKENGSSWYEISVNDSISSGNYRLKFFNTSKNIESYVVAHI